MPLAIAGRLDDDTKALYAILGLGTVTIEIEHAEYTALADHVAAAADILGGLTVDSPPLSSYTATVAIPCFSVPACSPQVSPNVAMMYKALGVATVDVVGDDQRVRTVALSHLARMRSDPYLSCACGRALPSTQPITVPNGGFTVQDYYTGPPPPPVWALARLFGLRFARVVGERDTYWVTKTPMFEATLTRLGLFC